jgi:acetoacetyl-CoA synthetase
MIGPLWAPADDVRATTRIGDYLRWLEAEGGLHFDTYDELWAWSVEEIEAFWSSLWEYFGIASRYDTVLSSRSMPGASWFTGARLNYAEHALRGAMVGGQDRPVVLAYGQTRDPQNLTAGELVDQVARARAGLRQLGVGAGDRVAAYLPNIPEAIVAFLAMASLGAIWSSCAPEFGTRSVVDRFDQIQPKVLLTVDGYRYGDLLVDRTDEVADLRRSLQSVETTVVVPYVQSAAQGDLTWNELVAEAEQLEFEQVPFDHPLYILYSSGTTGRPKAIVHGHGGILIEHLKAHGLHTDIGPNDRFFCLSTTGWMTWNYLISGLLVGASVITFDGNPNHPDALAIWRLIEHSRATSVMISATWIMNCRKAGIHPEALDLGVSAISRRLVRRCRPRVSSGSINGSTAVSSLDRRAEAPMSARLS